MRFGHRRQQDDFVRWRRQWVLCHLLWRLLWCLRWCRKRPADKAKFRHSYRNFVSLLATMLSRVCRQRCCTPTLRPTLRPCRVRLSTLQSMASWRVASIFCHYYAGNSHRSHHYWHLAMHQFCWQHSIHLSMKTDCWNCYWCSFGWSPPSSWSWSRKMCLTCDFPLCLHQCRLSSWRLVCFSYLFVIFALISFDFSHSCRLILSFPLRFFVCAYKLQARALIFVLCRFFFWFLLVLVRSVLFFCHLTPKFVARVKHFIWFHLKNIAYFIDTWNTQGTHTRHTCSQSMNFTCQFYDFYRQITGCICAARNWHFFRCATK